MKPADIRLGQHVLGGLVLGAAALTGYGVLGWRISWDADCVFNGATAMIFPYINSLPALLRPRRSRCLSLHSSEDAVTDSQARRTYRHPCRLSLLYSMDLSQCVAE